MSDIMKEEKPHYVNNAQFSQAVVNYVEHANREVSAGRDKPVIPDYVAMCFLRIAEGLSHKANFVRYTYREEMVMDAVENCLKAIENYNLETATRTGKPNAFAYFTQIAWYAFLRRIEKEKKQQDVKLKFIAEAGIEHFFDTSSPEDFDDASALPFLDELRGRIDLVKENDRTFKEYYKKEKRRRRAKVDSDLSEFLED
jgi:hypothetical protein